MATVGERVTLMDEGLGCWVLLAMTSASRISATVDAVVDLDRTQRSCATTRLKGNDGSVGDRIVVAAATLGGDYGEIIEVGSHGRPPYLCAGLMMSVRRFSSPARTPMSVIRVAAPLTASSDSGFRRLTFGEVDAEELRVQPRGGFHGPTPPRRSAVILVTYPGGGSGIPGNTTSGPR